MSFWYEFLPIIIYILLIVLLIVGIILGIRFIFLIGKAEKIMDNVDKKVKSLDGFFSFVDMATDKIVFITDKVVEGITALIAKLFLKNDEEEVIVVETKKKKKGKK